MVDFGFGDPSSLLTSENINAFIQASQRAVSIFNNKDFFRPKSATEFTAPVNSVQLYDGGKIGSERMAFSTNIYVLVGKKVIGLIQRININEDRDITPIYEIGTENSIYLVPTNSINSTLELEKVAISTTNLSELINYGEISVGNILTRFIDRETIDLEDEILAKQDIYLTIQNIFEQRFPFRIQLIENGISARGETPHPVRIRIFDQCWFSSLGREISSDNLLIIETATVKYNYCYSIGDIAINKSSVI